MIKVDHHMLPLGVAFLLLVCLGSCVATTAPSFGRVETGTTINITQAAQLTKTEYIELATFNVDTASASATTSSYTVIHAIRDPATIRQIVAALDQPLMVGMEPACIAEYQVYFYRSDNVVATFAYMCRDGRPVFIRGSTSDKSLQLGGQVQLSSVVRDALEPYLSSSP